MEDKYNLYKAVKLIKIIAKTEKTVLREREKALALVVFTYEDYATVVEDICAKCFD